MNERLTIEGLFCDIAMCREIGCNFVCDTRRVYEKLRMIETSDAQAYPLIQDEPNFYTLELSDIWSCGKCGEGVWYDENAEGFESPEDIASTGTRFCTYCGFRISGLTYHPLNRLVTDEEEEEDAHVQE